MAIKGKKGFKLNKLKVLINKFDYYFGEDQGRYIVEIEKKNLENLKKILKENNTHNEVVGTIQKEFFEIQGEMKINIKDLYTTNSKWYNNF